MEYDSRKAWEAFLMFLRAGRLAAAAFAVVAVSMAVVRCGGIQTATEPAVVAPTPLPAASPTSTPVSPTPTPAPVNSSVFGYVSTSDVTPHYLSGVLVTLHQDGATDQVQKSGSSDGSYSFCCLRPGPALITAALAGFQTFRATITVEAVPVRYDIRMIPSSGSPAPTGIPEPVG